MVFMAQVSDGARSVFVWIFGLLAVIIVAGIAQWFIPERTVQPIASRFLCSGSAEVTPATSTVQTEVLSRVKCVEGMGRSDVTNLAFALLCIPCAFLIAVAMTLGRRAFTRTPASRIQRINTT